MGEFSLVGLRVVRQVARRRSFSAAADDLGYTRSAVSRQVAAMEAAAGRVLFERHPRGVHPTEAGAMVARRADAVLAEIGGVHRDLDDLTTAPPGRVRMGAFSTALAALAPRALARFAVHDAQTPVRLHEGTSDRLIGRVARGRLDLAVVTPTAPASEEVERIALLEDPPLVAVGRDHRLAGQASVAADALRDEPWVAGGAEARSTPAGRANGARMQRLAEALHDAAAELAREVRMRVR